MVNMLLYGPFRLVKMGINFGVYAKTNVYIRAEFLPL